MDIEGYKNRAKAMLEQFDEICANRPQYSKGNYYLDIEDWAREFRHLVYAYDKSLPLNKELENDNLFVVHLSSDEESAKVRKYIKFFVNYLDIYGCEGNTNV